MSAAFDIYWIVPPLGRDPIHQDSGGHSLRDELRSHARARLAPRFPLPIGADAGRLRLALPRLQETRLVVAVAQEALFTRVRGETVW